MVKTESKWPKNLKKWRVVRRENDIGVQLFQTQAYIGWWVFGQWQDLGIATYDKERAIEWIETQCEPPKKVEEDVVWLYN